MTDSNIYMMTHCRFTPPNDDLYHPLQVGRALHPSLGYDGDDTGDNISSRNSEYCELTGVYWAHKNSPVPDDGIIGICHYRRCLLDDNGYIWNRSSISSDMKEHDILTTRRVTLDCSYHTGFGGRHNTSDLDKTGEALRRLYPEYYSDYERLVNQNLTYFGNMMISRRSLFDDYCSWLFDILFETERHVDMTGYDGYAKRLYGFLSEFLLYVWVQHNALDVHECDVAVIGEKKETRIVCDKMIDHLNRHDLEGSRECLMESMSKRPDILMEASDINGNLKLLMQITAACGFEDCNDIHMLSTVPDVRKLIPVFRRLNVLTSDMVAEYRDRGLASGTVAEYRDQIYNGRCHSASPAVNAYLTYCEQSHISRGASRTSLQIYCSDKKEYDEISSYLDL